MIGTEGGLLNYLVSLNTNNIQNKTQNTLSHKRHRHFHTNDVQNKTQKKDIDIYTQKDKDIVIRQIHGSMSAAADNRMQAPIFVAMSHDMPDRQYTIQGY